MTMYQKNPQTRSSPGDTGCRDLRGSMTILPKEVGPLFVNELQRQTLPNTEIGFKEHVKPVTTALVAPLITARRRRRTSWRNCHRSN
jgi:hypothetical protein